MRLRRKRRLQTNFEELTDNYFSPEKGEEDASPPHTTPSAPPPRDLPDGLYEVIDLHQGAAILIDRIFYDKPAYAAASGNVHCVRPKALDKAASSESAEPSWKKAVRMQQTAPPKQTSHDEEYTPLTPLRHVHTAKDHPPVPSHFSTPC